MSKHTPGPWVLIEGANIYSAPGSDSGDGIPADKTDGWHIAALGDSPTFVDGVEVELGYNVKQSNGQLMIAAPELLEALVEARKMLEKNLPTLDRNVGFCPNIVQSTVKAIEKVDAAIAKAKGEIK